MDHSNESNTPMSIPNKSIGRTYEISAKIAII
jgi:hypothetical protein